MGFFVQYLAACDRIFVMSHGAIVAEGSYEELKAQGLQEVAAAEGEGFGCRVSVDRPGSCEELDAQWLQENAVLDDKTAAAQYGSSLASQPLASATPCLCGYQRGRVTGAEIWRAGL